eukprot:2592000-Prymnesium_polylepis.1
MVFSGLCRARSLQHHRSGLAQRAVEAVVDRDEPLGSVASRDGPCRAEDAQVERTRLQVEFV